MRAGDIVVMSQTENGRWPKFAWDSKQDKVYSLRDAHENAVTHTEHGPKRAMQLVSEVGIDKDRVPSLIGSGELRQPDLFSQADIERLGREFQEKNRNGMGRRRGRRWW